MVKIQNNTALIPLIHADIVRLISMIVCPGDGTIDGTCSNHGTCDVSTGNCTCDSGFEGDMCQGKSFL